jgi:hypothetical protein
MALVILFCAVLLVTIVLVRLQSDPYTRDDSGKSITIDVGDNFEVELEYGQDWKAHLPPGATIALVNEEIHDCHDDLQGFTWCVKTFTFRGINAGQTQLPLERTFPSVDTFSLNVTVR